MTSARSDFSFKKKLQVKALLSSMMSSQCFLLPTVGVEGEFVSKKSLYPKIFDQGTAFLLMACCLALLNVQSSHGLKVPVTWIPRAFAVAWVINLEECPSSTCTSLIYFLQRTVADCALTSPVFQKNSTPTAHPSWVLILNSAIKDDLTFHRIDHNVVAVVAWHHFSLQKFAH